MEIEYTVISSYSNREQTELLVRKLEERGRTCYNFCATPADPDNPHLSPKEQMKRYKTPDDFFQDPYARSVFEKDMEALKSADKVILLLPAGKSSHIEAGIAYALRKHLILIGDLQELDSLYFIFKERYKTIPEFLASITQ